MALKLMYITNNPNIARIAEDAGVDRIFVDMEYIGKAARQGGMDTVQSHHTIDDVRSVRKVISKADVMVRINPIHEASSEYSSSEKEINDAIDAGADILMLPYFKTVEEVKMFLRYVHNRVRTLLLLETPEAVNVIDEILLLEGIDEIHIGLNDLSLGYGKKFMFELLADGTVEELCVKFKLKGIPYGFGGIAAIGKGELPAEYIIKEHYRLGSTCAILSRCFCNTNIITDMDEIRSAFKNGVYEIREQERECEEHASYFRENKRLVVDRVKEICRNK